MTTFAPASHDAERHDLASHSLAQPTADALPVTPNVADYQPQQNGLNGVLPPSQIDGPTDTPASNPKEQLSSIAGPTLEESSPDHQLPLPEVPTATFAAESAPAPAAISGDIGDQSVQSSLEPGTPIADNALLSANAPALTAGLNAPASVDEQPTAIPAPVETVATATDIPAPVPAPVANEQSTAAAPQPAAADAMDTSFDQPSAAPTAPETPNASEQPESKDHEMADAPGPVKTSRDREDDDTTDEPSAKRARTDDAVPAPTEHAAAAEGDQSVEATSQPATEASASAPAAPDAPRVNGVAPYKPPEIPSFGDFTEAQKKKVLEGMRNLKKNKHSLSFAKPVDPEALKLPTYSTIVKQPMDMSTIETKLKEDQYKSVNDYVADFDLMVYNAIIFNGQAHPVAQAGQILRSVLGAQLGKLPKAGEQIEAAPQKKAPRQSLPPREPPRRAARPAAAAPPTPTQAPIAPLDGQPIIRRGSNLGDRPKRKIQKPAPRDLSYARTPKKKFQAELKFADEVLTEMKRPRYQPFSGPFMEPVDPVALNIPTYFKIIKKPMAVSNIAEKMSKHQYENLKEFENDFRQIIINCFKFNPAGTAVHNMGKQFEELFNSEMSKKDERLTVLAPASAAQSPTVDSDEEASEDDEDAEERERMEKIRALNEQVAAIQQQAQELMAGSFGKPAKASGKGKGGKGTGTKRKSNGGAGAPARSEKKQAKAKAKAAPKKPKPLTSSQKQEIADRIGELPTEEINRVADQIKASLRRAGKPVPPDDEMEFQIDDIPDDLLHELLGKVRKNAPIPSKEEDDDFVAPAAPRGGSGGGHKPKKNKPMTKTEQEAQINRLEGQLATFQGGADEGMFGDDDKQDEDSSDDDSGSESEEE